jgi:hypothetical protein
MCRMSKLFSWQLPVLLLVSWLALPVRAEQIVLKNGDVLNGTVLSMSSNVLVLKNENLGVVNLQRTKIVAIHFGEVAATNTTPVSAVTNVQARLPAAPQPGAGADLSVILRGIRADSNLVQQVQTQVLGDASPEASAKFNELLDGLSTGKIDMNGLRAEAKKAVDQMRAFKKEMGSDAGDELDGYLSILETFLRETAPTNTATQPMPAAKSNSTQR